MHGEVRLSPEERLQKSAVVRGMLFLIGSLCVVLWAVVGFVLWIPMLTRMILIFAAAQMKAVYTNADTTNAERGLDFAVTFYLKGFMRYISFAVGHRSAYGPMYPESERLTWMFIFEIFFAVLFWVGISTSWYIVVNNGWATFSGAITRSVAAVTPVAKATFEPRAYFVDGVPIRWIEIARGAIIKIEDSPTGGPIVVSASSGTLIEREDRLYQVNQLYVSTIAEAMGEIRRIRREQSGAAVIILTFTHPPFSEFRHVELNKK
jgi:hypothetical protein